MTRMELTPLRQKLGFDYFFVVDCTTSFGGRRGGLCLFWSESLELQIMSYSDHHIDTNVRCVTEDTGWRLTGIHGWAEEHNKPRTWQLLRELRTVSHTSWLCVGDFNDILYAHEKSGGNIRDHRKMEAFQSAVDECNLEDLGFSGSLFTWSNGQGDTHNIQERLDRCLANPSWSRLYQFARVDHLLRFQSDHSPIQITWKPLLASRNCQRGKKPFRFEAMWLHEASCSKVVQESWHSQNISSSPSDFAKKSRKIADSLSTWERNHFGHVSTGIEIIRRELEKKQAEAPTLENLPKVRSMETELRALTRKAETMWKQRSRAVWLSDGDKNSAFFHRTATGRKKRNSINRIKNAEEQWVEEDFDIEKAFLDYFKSIFHSEATDGIDEVIDAISPKVSAEENRKLCKAYTEEEVIEALNQMHPLKAPGPDGIPALFYSHFWSTIKHDLLSMVLNILNDGASPAPINHTHIVLIPKKKSPDSPKDFRPISLCNVALKLVTKCIANRLKPILPTMISQAQSAFIQDRLITDNALLAFELFHSMKTNTTRKRSSFALKLDMSKAYDRVEWSFLERVLGRFGFEGSFLNNIMRCVSTVSYSIIINGKPSEKFTPTHGLRQGDPLSPYLFLCCAEAFSALIHQAETAGILHGAKICKLAPEISHLFFADDSLIFGKASMHELAVVRTIVDKYTRASGQRVNFEKSEISFSRDLPPEQIDYLGSLSGVLVVEKISIYLGLPTNIGRSKKEIFSSIIDRVQKKLKNWKSKVLSQAGKLILIKAVAQSIPSYVMSVFKLPLSVIHRLNQIISNFWWGQKSEEKRIHWCSWDSTCSPKNSGGLGIRDFESFNLAFLAKQGWRILTNPDSLLARCLKPRYFPRCSFLEAKTGFTPSFTWRSIIAGHPVLLHGTRWNVRNGLSVRIWNDPWVPNFPSLTPPPHSSFLQDVTMVRDLLNQMGDAWNSTLIRSIFPDIVCENILAIPICSSPQEDCLQWIQSKDGVFTVKSGYWIAKMLKDVLTSKPSSSSNNSSNWKWIWSLNIPPKIKIFTWKCMRGILPTKAKLCSMGLNIDPICLRCGLAVENLEHTLRDCTWCSFFWNASPLRVHVPTEASRIPLQDWLLLHIKGKSPKFIEYFVSLLWIIWKARNCLQFQQQHLSHQLCFSLALTTLSEFQATNPATSRPSSCSTDSPHWLPPQAGWVKINTDASIGPLGRSGLGGAIRDCNNAPLRFFSEFIRARLDVDIAEAKACLRGLMVAREEGFRAVAVETDNKTLASFLQKDFAPRSYLGSIIQDILNVSRSFELISFKWVSRSCNRLAHEIAKLARNSILVTDASVPLPVALSRIIAVDAAFL